MDGSLIIARLRDECPSFNRRFYGAGARLRTMNDVLEEKRGVAVPCGFAVWEGDDPSDDERELMSLDTMVERTYSVTVAVDGTGDNDGTDASERLQDAGKEIIAALNGWAPSGGNYGRLIYLGAPDAPLYNRAYGAQTFLFSGSYQLSAP